MQLLLVYLDLKILKILIVLEVEQVLSFWFTFVLFFGNPPSKQKLPSQPWIGWICCSQHLSQGTISHPWQSERVMANTKHACKSTRGQWWCTYPCWPWTTSNDTTFKTLGNKKPLVSWTNCVKEIPTAKGGYSRPTWWHVHQRLGAGFFCSSQTTFDGLVICDVRMASVWHCYMNAILHDGFGSIELIPKWNLERECEIPNWIV